MGKKGRNVIGTTSTTAGPALSDEAIQYKLERKRTVRFMFQKVKGGFIAWVCGPFHSRMYGANGSGTKRSVAKRVLTDNLARDFGFIGTMLHTNVDEADNVGKVDTRLLDGRAIACPITCHV